MDRRDASGIPGGGGLFVDMGDEDDVLDDGNDDDEQTSQKVCRTQNTCCRVRVSRLDTKGGRSKGGGGLNSQSNRERARQWESPRNRARRRDQGHGVHV